MVFFDGWWPLMRVLVVGLVGYVALVATLRLSGKRTLAKMNAFDFVVTVALGSTLASVLTSKQVPLAEGILALALLVALQVTVAFIVSRWPGANRLVKSEPRLIASRGELLREAMLAERITEDDVRAAVRQRGLQSLEQAEAVVLEANGDISVIPRTAPS